MSSMRLVVCLLIVMGLACSGPPVLPSSVPESPTAHSAAEVQSWIEWGPMLGPSTHRSTTVVVQLDRAAEVAVRWAGGGSE